MLPLKLVRYLVLGETINHNPYILNQNPPHTHDYDIADDNGEQEEEEAVNEAHATSKPNNQTRRTKSFKSAGLLFLSTKEIITNTYRLATIARELGIDFYPTPSLSHIIFSNPSSTPSSSSSSSTPSTSPSASSSLPNDAVPIPFPSLTAAPITHLRHFVTLSSRAFKIVLFNSDRHPDAPGGNLSNWDCCSVSLYSRVTCSRVDTMDGFCRVLAGKGWTFFKTKKNPSADQRGGGGAVYLFRKLDINRVRVGRVGAPHGACRVRELKLPHLDFENAPLRILQYILLMTDDIFCLV